LKRVMAYSTVSQLGFMFLGLGSGRMELAILGVVAAIFHLFTHAFFKALLFLASGSVMHAMGGVIDMRRIGGLRKVLPVTHWTFLCGALALSGFPLLSGFWSKDEILGAAQEAGTSSSPYSAVYMVLMLLSSVIAVAGIGVAYLMYVAQPGLATRCAGMAGWFYHLSLNKFYIDELYDIIIINPLNAVTRGGLLFDNNVIDELVNVVG